MARTPERWDVEDDAFWESTGKSIANRNLWVSIPNLLCGFSVWLYWGMIAKTMQRLHFANTDLFNFTFRNDGMPYDETGYRALLFTLPAVAGLAGATLRIPNSFMIAICGGRNVKFMTTVMLIIPAFGAGFALQNPETPFYVYIILAAMSGVGGGAFASSMSNISFFFPKRVQGLALGLNAGLGNAGVSVMQFLIPWAITFGMFGALGGDPQEFQQDGGTKQLWIQNAAMIWVPIMTILAVLAWIFMNNLPQHKCGSAPVAIGKYLWLQIIGFLGAAVGVVLLVFVEMPIPELLRIFVVLVAAVVATLLGMRFMTPQTIQEPLQKQFAIFSNKHNWVMTWLYVMTFGSFIGYANAFPKLIDDVFVTDTNKLVTSNFIWIGAFVGALIRPVGGWLSDRLGGARVTQWDTWVMVAATITAGYLVALAGQSETPEEYFVPFLVTFIVLFATTGIGNGSTFRMIPIIFEKEQAGPVLGWTSAIAAYGAYLIPKIFATQIEAGTPEYALYGFAAYYASCLLVNWWFYARVAEPRFPVEEQAMKQPYVTAVLLIGVLFAGALFAASVAGRHWPDSHQGYGPSQPIAYSHRLHADELQIECRYCHSNAMESQHAGIPSGNVCMRCHKFVTSSFDEMQAELRLSDEERRKPKLPVSDELRKLYDAMGLDEELKPLDGQQPEAIRWVRVHNLPDYVYFDHRAHVAAGVTCQHCHGPVESMQQVEQFSSLSMGWCVNCHRDAAQHGVQGQPANPSLDCAACHY